MITVLEDMPRMLRAEEDVIAVPPAGIGSNTLVPAHTRLLVKRRFKLSLSNTEYLQCSDGDQNYAFSEHSRVNFTAIQDTTAYTLEQLFKFQTLILPAVVQFQTCDVNAIAHYDDQLATTIMLIAEGPVELIGSVQNEVLVGWVRDHELKTYKTVLIPNGVWGSLHVQRSQMDKMLTENYFKRKFSQCPDSKFVESGLYMLKLRQRDTVWLKSPKLFTLNQTGSSLKTAVKIDFNDSTDDEDEHTNYDEPSPPIPERVPIPKAEARIGDNQVDETKDDGEKLSGESVEHNIRRKKMLFGHIHFELKHWFKKKKKKKIDEKQPGDQQQQSNPARSSSKARNKKVSSSKQWRAELPIYSIPVLSESKEKHNSDSLEENSEDELNNSYEIPVEGGLDTAPAIPPKTYRHGSGKNTPDSIKSWPVTLDQELSDSVSSHLYITPTSDSADVEQKEKQGYAQIGIQDMQLVLKEGQKREDFYKLSVVEVSHLFRHCSLQAIAQVCYEQRLDGRFFKDFDVEEMKEEPFKASKFDIIKVKQIIENGWRPRVE